MRVWFRKIHCPSFTCFFCKPPQHLCTSPTPASNPANIDPTDLHSAVTVSVAASSDHLCSVKKEDEEKEESVDDDAESKISSELVLRSSIKRKDVEEGSKKTVKWMDVAGKELVQVKEFETSEPEDTDSDSEFNRGCICPIL